MTLPELAAPQFRSIDSLIEQSDSAKRENGSLSAFQIMSGSRRDDSRGT